MKSVCVTSGKGGVGKSNVSVNLGIALAQRGKRVLLFDADLSLANVDILLGISCEHTLVDVLEGRQTLAAILVDCEAGLKVLPATSGILKLERLSPSARVRLAKDLSELSEEFDLLLIDTGAGMTENVLFFAHTADEVLLVTTPEPTAMTDTYAMIKVLYSKYDVASITLLVNRVQTNTQGKEIHARLDGICNRFLSRRVNYLGAVPHDSALERAVLQRKPVITAAPNCPASNAISGLARRFDQVFTAKSRDVIGGLWEAMFAPPDGGEPQ